ncbi:MAG TPA: hypothetical protein VJS92_08785 [Candidatus Polarisedimenticolaceae bacterium]|nr:hypothetical protein [Candidatus Polarisedimenticolaceae bacterium]
MAAEAKQKAEGKEKKEAKEKKAKAPAEAPAQTATAAEPKTPPPPPPPRTPADPRLRVLKKFQGVLLPKGIVRERYRALMVRWDSGNDHGGVTLKELEAVLDDWKGTRERPPRLPKA